MDKLQFENNTPFNFLLIKPIEINTLDWSSENYTQQLIDLPIYELINSNSDNFLYDVNNVLSIETYNNIELITQIICEEPNYIYELLYLLPYDKKTINANINNVANLINTNDDIIYGNAILLKTLIPINNISMLVSEIIIHDVKHILDNRVKTKIVIYDSETWKEDICIGNLENYANNFFDDNNYKKLEIAFLMYNINIWYDVIENITNNNICGSIINKPIYKCLWFTMISDEYRGSITLEEVQKIIKVSNHLKFPYMTKDEWISEEIDNIGRKVIKNKYRVLEYALNYFQL